MDQGEKNKFTFLKELFRMQKVVDVEMLLLAGRAGVTSTIIHIHTHTHKHTHTHTHTHTQ